MIVKSQAFTLLEILVVAAVVGILAALLVGPVGGLIERSRISASISNLRQCHVTALQYAADNDGVYPDVKDGKNRIWLTKLWALTYPEREFPGYGHNLKGTIYHTPLIESDTNARTFGLNGHLSAGNPGLRWGLLPNPSRIAFLGDTRTSSSFVVQQVNPRNNGKVNILFLDGHVESLKPEDVPADKSAYFWSALPENPDVP